MIKRSDVTCGECDGETIFVVCEWPPSFFWCRHCNNVFTFQLEDGDNGITWQLRERFSD